MNAELLTEAFLAQAAGWQAMKEARRLLAAGQVLSSDWSPPLLKGVVQDGATSYRAGLVIKNAVDIENLCACRPSREWGTLCAHSVAVGLHHLRGRPAGTPAPAAPSAPGRIAEPPANPAAPSRSPETRLTRAPAEAGGEPAELCVILPPNFAAAAGRGAVTLFFEGRRAGRRAPLNALPRGQPLAFSAQDAAVLDRIEALAGGQTPAMLRLGSAQLAGLLPLLAGHPRVTLGKATPLAVTAASWTPPVRARRLADGGIEVSLAATAPVLVAEGWVFRENTLQPLGLPASCRNLLRGPVQLSREQVPDFLMRDWPQLAVAGRVEADFSPDDFDLDPVRPQFRLLLAGGLARLEAQLECAYAGHTVAPGRSRGAGPQAGPAWLPDPDCLTRFIPRDLAAEQAALGELARAGFTGPDTRGRWRLEGQEAVLDFFARALPRLQRAWEVRLEEPLARSAAQRLERIEPQFRITPSGTQWFDFSVRFAAPGGPPLSAADLQRLLLSGRSHTRLPDGRFGLLDLDAVEELQETLRDCAPEQHSGGYRIGRAQTGFLEATLRERCGWRAPAPDAWRACVAGAGGPETSVCPPLGELEAVLRPYQKAGVAWLAFLRQNGFGGVLADEMGLGKTLQVLALVASVARARAAGEAQFGPARPSLVICPASLVFNWVAEARKFTPQLRVLALHGPERQALFARIPESDLVVTSYALARRDAARYRALEFDTVVLDEAQHIKNRQTENARAVKAIRAAHRLALTGTPLENAVGDVWSLFDFLMPGYLGPAAEFRERYELPLARDPRAPARERLARRLRPFVLRRLKREVAPELPLRLEQVAWCELTEAQRAVYQQVLEAGRAEVLAAVGRAGRARSRMVVLTALLRLRQVCCDLRLLQLEAGQPAAAGPGESSGKLELFGELLDEALDGGHRVLVFSQFTSMLALLRQRLEAQGVEFCQLDGATPNRAEVVARFQEGAAPVFLISLKAGGVGLNLTAADTVIHFDPWWNPAVEDQATDRAHRLGQRRVVTSYKLITRGTVEEKMLQLQQRKRELIAATLGGEAGLAEALSWEDIQTLLAE